ncbi:MAG: DUF58 domain-containing protein [Oscillospiraceae bacterium]|nr:DUF58 domain-containing protein [Oscillospiraceae bacterium]
MREFRTFFISVIVILFILCYAYHSQLMPLLLVTVLLICGISFVLSLITKSCMETEVDVPPEVVERKSAFNLNLQIKNNFIMPLTPVRIYVKVCEKGTYKPQNKMLIISLDPFRQINLNLRNVVSFRGEYIIGVERVEFFDLLKIFKFKVYLKEPRKLMSYPRELTLGYLSGDNQEDTEISQPKPHGFNKDVFSHLREYREGESLRHIHWNLSVKLDELIVKQMESNYDQSSLIFCDFCSEMLDFPTEYVLHGSDLVIETSLAIIRRIILSGNSAFYLYQANQENATAEEGNQDTGSQIRHPENLSDCFELSRKLAFLPVEPFNLNGTGSFTDLFDEFYHQLRNESAVYIVTPSVSEDLIEKLRSMGLLFRNNVVLAAIAPFQPEEKPRELKEGLNNPEKPEKSKLKKIISEQDNLLSYLESGTKIKVVRIKGDTDKEIESFGGVTLL